MQVCVWGWGGGGGGATTYRHAGPDSCEEVVLNPRVLLALEVARHPEADLCHAEDDRQQGDDDPHAPT